MYELLNDLNDEILCEVLSFLPLAEVWHLATVSRRIFRLFKEDDSSLWHALCHRRWKEFTDMKSWHKKIGWRGVARLLHKWEGLIGVWKGFVGNNGDKSQELLVFDWGVSSVQGFRITQAAKGSFHVKKVPFLWLGVSSAGDEMCLVHAGGDDSSSAETKLDEATCSCARDSVFSKLDDDRSREELVELGFVPVNVKFVGKHHIVIDEVCAQKRVGEKQLRLGEAVASASFGVSNRVVDQNCESAMYGQSPRGSFSYEMYQFLTSKVTSSGGDRGRRRQRKKEKERAESRGIRRPLEQQHFVKVDNSSHRPLEGLEGLCKCKGLEYILLSYINQGIITCQQVGASINLARDSALVTVVV